MQKRKASIKETGEELTTAEWERFDAAVAGLEAERKPEPVDVNADVEADKKVDAPSVS